MTPRSIRRLWSGSRGRRLDATDPDVRAELQAHLDARIVERMARGDHPHVALLAAEARFGSLPEIASEATRARRRAFRTLRPRADEVRQALRTLRRTPWYSSTIVAVLGLAMALSTTVFAVVDGVLFKPLSYPAADQLYAIEPGFKGLSIENQSSVSANQLAAWSAAVPDAALTGFRVQPWGGLGSGLNDDVAGVALVQPNFFDVMGVQPLIGGFRPADSDADPARRPVVVMYDVWQHRFQGDPGVVGRTIALDTTGARVFVVAGVMPPGFVFPSDRWEVSFLSLVSRSDAARPQLTQVIVRVPAGSSPQSIGPRVESSMQDLARAQPPRGPKPAGWSDRGWRMQGPPDQATVSPLSSVMGRRSRPLFSTAFIAVLVIVVLGATNASGLMASRVLDRRVELSLRRALGASGLAIGRLIFIEALVLVAAGAALGLCLAPSLLALSRSLLPEDLVLFKTPALDWRVAMFVAGSVVLLAIPTSAWPIWRAVRTTRQGSASGDRSGTSARSAGRQVVIAAQIAGAFALTVVGTLLVSSLLLVYAGGHPIRTDGIVLLEGMIDGPGSSLDVSPERTVRATAILNRLKQTPGISAVAITAAQVLRGGNWVSWFEAPKGAADKHPAFDIQPVTADYYRVVQPQLVAGRLPSDDELARDARVIVISETVARTFWPGISPLGQTLTQQKDAEPFTVVGVVKDVRWQSWDAPAASIYGPYKLLSRSPSFTFLIRADASAGRVMHDAMTAIAAVDPHVPIRRGGLLDDLFVDSVRPRRFRSWLFGSFAAAGLAVVGVGIFGLLAMSAARRTREIGIRQALGARPADITRALVREPLTSVIAGLAAGGLLAAWGVQFVSSTLYRVTATDPRPWAAAVAVIVVVAGAGTLAPALRASRVDPVKALRAD